MKRRRSKPEFNLARLVRARRLKRWSTAKIAAEIGCSENYILQIESGSRRLTEKIAFAWSEKLEVPMDEVLVIPGGHAA